MNLKAALCAYGSGAELTMTNSTVEKSSHTGLYIQDTSATVLTSCSFSNNTDGITISESTGCTINRCVLKDNSYHGVYILNSDGCSITENAIYGTTNPYPNYGIYVTGCSPPIKRNEIYNVSDGIALTYGASPAVWNNLIYENLPNSMSNGIKITSDDVATESKPVIYHNTINGGTFRGIKIAFGNGSGPVSPEIEYNIISNFHGMPGYDSGYGVYRETDEIGTPVSGSPVINYNNVWNNSPGGNYASVVAGDNDMSQDPKFAGYKLGAASPCINAVPEGVPPDDPVMTDLEGMSRPYGPGFDMGCYENHAMPELSTTLPYDIANTSASSGGNIVDAGHNAQTIKTRGVCWSTQKDPTILDQHTMEGTGLGLFSSTMGGLLPDTTYHVRAYASNEKGQMGYGEDRTFTTTSSGNKVEIVSMSDTQLKYCPPVMNVDNTAIIKLLAIYLDTFQSVRVTWYLDDVQVINYDVSVSSSPFLDNSFTYQMTAQQLQQFNSLGVHTVKVTVADTSRSLLAQDEKSYELVTCSEGSLSVGPPSSQCLGGPPDSIPASFHGDGGGSTHAIWTDDLGNSNANTIPEGDFNAVNYLPTGMQQIFDSAGFHYLRLDAPLNASSDIYLSDTVLFDIQPCGPVVTSFSPTEGGEGTNVLILGKHFTDAMAVSFGGTAAAGFTVDSNTEITAVVGKGATGKISVTNSVNTGESSSSFTFTPPVVPPTVTSFDPTRGGKDTEVIIKGTGFTGTEVKFGGTPAASFTVDSETQITAVVGDGATGKVTVTTAAGTGESEMEFTFVETPTITGFTPTIGGSDTEVTITGTAFDGATQSEIRQC